MAQHIDSKARFHAVTSNRLLDGEPVYLTAAHAWSVAVGDAAIADGREAGEALMQAAARDVDARLVVNPYLFNVDASAGVAVPVSVRERIRANGPTVRRDLGKQARAAA